MRMHRATEPVRAAARRAGAPSPLERGCRSSAAAAAPPALRGEPGRAVSSGSEGKYESGHEHDLRKCFQADSGGTRRAEAVAASPPR